MIEVTFSGITKRFESVVAVDDLSLDIRAGELFFLLGPSGCGKTTALRLVAGFYRPNSGQLRFQERVVNDLPPHLRNTGMVFQNYALWPHMTVFDNVAYGLRVRKVDGAELRRRVEETLEIVQMRAFADRLPSQMSGGQQQRVALARALVVRPDVLLLDEPLSNLDAKLRHEMRSEIRRIHESAQITTIYVTHDQKEALSIADRMAVLRNGRIEQVGSPREIYRTPANVFVAEFVGETTLLHGRVQTVGAGFATLESPHGVLRGRIIATSVQPGSTAVCAVRPESLRMTRERPQTADNRLEATVQRVTYLGEVEQCELRFADGGMITVSVSNPGAEPLPANGRVWLTFAAEDAFVLESPSE